MHPEIISETPGTCPKCGGMKLVPIQDQPILKVIQPEHDTGLGKITFKNYLPLVVVIGVIFLTTIAISLQDSLLGVFSFVHLVRYFMIGFFLTFGTFKLMDLNGFKEGYSTYDLIAKRLPAYGYVYPFIEIFFGLAMILIPQSQWLLVAEIAVMGFSGLGVAIKIAKKEPFLCACLGTFLKVPLTKVTLIEDFGMAALAAMMLFIGS